jgi:hypothetical protein
VAQDPECQDYQATAKANLVHYPRTETVKISWHSISTEIEEKVVEYKVEMDISKCNLSSSRSVPSIN